MGGEKKSPLRMLSRFRTIRGAMIFSYMAITLLALLIFLLFSLNYTERTILENSESYTIQLVEQVKADDEIRALVITGSGEKAFVAGADIGEMSTLTKAEGEAFGKKGNDVFRKLETLPIPTIAAVNGFALGGGCELSMSCDIRICADTAVFGQPEAGLGITPGFGGTQRLARLVGPGMAKQLIYTAKNIKADEALRIGLVNAVYPAQELLPAAEKLAGTIAKNAPIAVRACKKAINDGLQVDMDRAVTIEEKLFGSCFETADQKEGMGAFLEKRKHEPYQNR